MNVNDCNFHFPQGRWKFKLLKSLSMRNIIVLIIWLFWAAYVSAQSYVLAYGSRQISSNDPKLLKTRNLSLEKAIKENEKRIRVYQLTHSEARSVYTEKYSSINGVRDEGLTYFGGNMVVYKDFSKGEFIQTGKFVGANNAVKESIEEFFKWTIIPKSDTVVFGLPCQRASTLFRGKKVVAWFTKSIPIMDGPGIFSGLPGLILRVDLDSSMVIEIMDLQIVKNKVPVNIPSFKDYVSFEEYLKNRYKFMD